MISSASGIAWAGAPLLAYFHGETYGAAVAAILLCTGYTLAFTQMRAAPKEALIVSGPYTVVTLIILANAWDGPGFWTLLALTPVVGVVLLIKVLITQTEAEAGGAALKKEKKAATPARQAAALAFGDRNAG